VLAPLLLLAPRLTSSVAAAGQRPRHLLLPVVVGILLPIMPVTAINYIRSGDPVLIASQGGINFYAGNNARADGRHVVIPELSDLGGWEDFEPRVVSIAEAAAKRRLGPSGVSNWWFDRGLAWIRAEPARAAQLVVVKAGALLSGYEQPNNRDIAVARHDSLLLSLLVGRVGPISWPWGFLLPLALLGMTLAPSNRLLRLPVAAAFLYGVSLLPFFICDRFRLPLVPFLAIPAGIGIARIPEVIRGPVLRHLRPLAALLLGLFLGAMTWGADTRVNEADSWHRLGEALYNDGRPFPSLDAFDEAVRRNPDDPSTRLGRAWALLSAADSLNRVPDPIRAATLDSLAGTE
ncbi:MAG: Uncharacterized protein FD129_2662, partial [bacterium]